MANSRITSDREREAYEKTINDLNEFLPFIKEDEKKKETRSEISRYQTLIDDYDRTKGSRMIGSVLKGTTNFVFGTPKNGGGGKGKTRRRKQRRIKTTKTSKRNKKSKKTK